jgi:hypothetical protein
VLQTGTRRDKNCQGHPITSLEAIGVEVVEKLTRNPAGDTGEELRFTAQSRKVELPRIAKTITFMSSIGTDLITIDFVPIRQSASTNASLSLLEGFV